MYKEIFMKLVKKWVLPIAFVVLAAVAILLIALTSVKSTDLMLVDSEEYKRVLFGANQRIVIASGTTVITELKYGATVLPLVGWILIVVGLLCGGISVFALKDSKMKALVLVVAALLVIAGGVFQFFMLKQFAKVYSEATGLEYDKAWGYMKDNNFKCPLATVGGILALVSGGVLAVEGLLSVKK